MNTKRQTIFQGTQAEAEDAVEARAIRDLERLQAKLDRKKAGDQRRGWGKNANRSR